MVSEKIRKREWVQAQIRPGRIITVRPLDVAHRKHVIVASANPFLGFYINKKLTPFVESKPHLMMNVVEIRKEDHAEFLTRDVSYVNCNSVNNTVTKALAIRQIFLGEGEFQNDLTGTERVAVRNAVGRAKDIAPVDKAAILDALDF